VAPPFDLRAEFPLLQQFTWLNAAASSPVSSSVSAAMEAHLKETRETGDLGYSRWAGFKIALRARFAAFIGATAREVAFTPSTSFGFHVIGQMLKARGVREVLTLESEFPSTTLPLLYDGLTLRGVRPRADGSFPIEDLEAALTPQTGAVAVSVVQFSSGYRVDLPRLAALCRERKLPLCLNAAQALGQVPLDFAGLGAAFLAGTSHKWFMGGYGVGFLAIAEEWLEAVPVPFGGWLSVRPEEQFQPWVHAQRVDDAHGFTATGTRFRKDASAIEAGGGAWTPLHGVNAALALHEQVGVANTLAHNIGLQLELRSRLRERGFTPNAPDDPATLSGICVVPVEGDPAEVVRTLVREAKVVTTPRGGGLRISTHAYNTREDLERLLEAIDRHGIEKRGQATFCSKK
jgi:selenocysteine lyase/cysteine desulfurase